MMIFLLSLLLLCPQQPATPPPIKVGILVSTKPSIAEVGATMRATLSAYFDEVNAQGGIDGRKLELIPVSIGGDTSATTASINHATKSEGVVAFVGGVIAGDDEAMAAIAQAEGVPMIGPATLTPALGTPLNRFGFYLFSGVNEQARALVNFAAAKPELKNSPALILNLDDGLSLASATGALEQARKLGWSNVTKASQTSQDFKAADWINAIRDRKARTVFVFASTSQLKEFIDLLKDLPSVPAVMVHGIYASSIVPADVPPQIKEKLFLSFPTIPDDVSSVTEYRGLQSKYGLPGTHLASQISVLAAGKVFVEAVRRSPKNFSRQQLITALEGMQNFNTGYSPPITFGPARRIGALGAYMISIDPQTNQFVKAGNWVSVE